MADQPESELAAIRHSLRGGLPFGEPAWVGSMAARLGRPIQRRPPGRPRKTEAAC